MKLETYVNTTIENLKKAIKKLKSKINYDLLKNFIENGKFERKTLLLGGSQISGSLSPFMHTYNSLKYPGKEFLYTLFDMTIENLQVKDVLKFIKENKSILGANVTMPYKIQAYEILNNEYKLDDSALLVGAVNTIAKDENGNLIGYNTDMEGVYLPIKNTLKQIPSKAIVFGAGGASRAVVSALLKLGVKDIKVLNKSKKDEFVNHFNSKKVKELLGVDDYKVELFDYWVEDNTRNQISKFVDDKIILANTLPYGFKDILPRYSITEQEYEKIKDKIVLYFDVVYDLKYSCTPMEEKLQKDGIKTLGGYDMVVNQAKKGFELWTKGEEFDVNEMIQILKN